MPNKFPLLQYNGIAMYCVYFSKSELIETLLKIRSISSVFIAISSRLEMEIIHEEYTSEDEKEWEREIIEMDKKMEERMRRYEENLKLLFSSAVSDTQTPEKDADYFIREYGERFIGRNPDNIKNRLKLYNKYLEQD